MDAISRLRSAFGENAVLIGGDIPERHSTDWSGAPPIAPLALLRPRTTADVSAMLRICHEQHQPVTPQGGLTGLVGGGRPSPGSVALSLELLNGIEEISAAASSITALAGTPLQIVQQAAEREGMQFSLDIGSRGSCTVGGNIATNAGGNRVLRYGMMRELVLGLEAVLADGTIVSSMNRMIKNNSGLDLKQLFIGAEGCTGIVTRAVLKLHPRPRASLSAFCRCVDFDAVLALLRRAERDLDGTLSSFEAMWPDFYDFVGTHMPHLRRPLEPGRGLYVLLEQQTSDAGGAARFEALLASAFEEGLAADAVVAQSESEAASFWAIRHAGSEYGHVLGTLTSFDISFTADRIETVVRSVEQALKQRWPDLHVLIYGHVGDGNIHVICAYAKPAIAPAEEISKIVYAIVREHGGAISAEHGIGTRKLAYLPYSRNPDELMLLRTVKHALDPRGLLNPGKMIA